VDNPIDILVSPTPLSLDRCYDFVVNEGCGGICLFVGTVRDHNKGEDVTHLEFEAYNEMAVKEMHKIAAECCTKFSAKKVAIHHRSGHVSLTEKAVIIAISTVHRKNAFLACEYAIDRLKETVPIWKKEFLQNGSYWVNARP